MYRFMPDSLSLFCETENNVIGGRTRIENRFISMLRK